MGFLSGVLTLTTQYMQMTLFFSTQGDRILVLNMMNILRRYEEVSGQMINKSKSYFYLHEKTPLIFTVRLRKLTGIRKRYFSFMYLGCHVFYGRKRNKFFEEIMRKISRRIWPCQNRFLSFSGKFILISHVQRSMPIHLLSAMDPPKGVTECIFQIFTKLFQSNSHSENRRHWSA